MLSYIINDIIRLIMNNIIANSVLPLNNDGSAYHLRLQPHEIADTIIFVGDPDRVASVSQHFDKITLQKQHREFVTHTGYFQQQPLTVISTGIGAGNIDIVINEIDALKNIDFNNRQIKSNPTVLTFIRLGTTGALQPNLQVGDIIMSSYAAGFDGLLHFYKNHSKDSSLHQVIQQQLNDPMLNHNLYTAAADSDLLQRFKDLGQSGITLTMHGFYGAQNRSLRLPLSPIDLLTSLQNLQYESLKVTNFEMETAMIYALCSLLGHRALSINNIVYNRLTEEKCPNPKTAMQLMISKTLSHLFC